MHKLSTLGLAHAHTYRFPTPLPRGASFLELWETQAHDLGPYTQEYRLVAADGRTLCTRSFYPSVQEVKNVG